MRLSALQRHLDGALALLLMCLSTLVVVTTVRVVIDAFQ